MAAFVGLVEHADLWHAADLRQVALLHEMIYASKPRMTMANVTESSNTVFANLPPLQRGAWQ